MSDNNQVQLTGTIIEAETGKGSKSHQKHNILLRTAEGDFHLRLNGSNPFEQAPVFKNLVGQEVTVTAQRYDYLLLVMDMQDIVPTKGPSKSCGHKGPKPL